ncbi:hypothetical protein [uncultured Tenacibaculum sp.]|uniref:hypothetical protein n=1 Tax=uncultured Tenacibaculum sp. TaxID=174713 RepID=UPI002622FB93|nr:hypothetical protein [uncultured Tenacibaculum sp.]
MRYYITLVIILVSQFTILGQNSSFKSFVSPLNEIEVNVKALDEVKIQNSETNEIEIHVLSQSEQHYDVITKEFESFLKIDFKASSLSRNVFRKYITKRVNRASVLIKIPENKSLTIVGENVDVISENYKGDLNIFIEKGYVNLNEVKRSLNLKLFQGNVYFSSKKSNFNIKTNRGKIKCNDSLKTSPYLKKNRSLKKQIKVSSIRANIFVNEL